MNQTLSQMFNTGTWFSTVLYFISEYFDSDLVFKSIMAMLSFTLLVLQITNQWYIRKERRAKTNKNE